MVSRPAALTRHRRRQAGRQATAGRQAAARAVTTCLVAAGLASFGATSAGLSAARPAGATVAPHVQPAGIATSRTMVRVIAAESQYANVAAQVGGRYVRIDAVMTNPDTDPHDFEASLRVASEINQAQIAVQNGLGYDVFMSKLEAADGPRGQMVVVAGNLVRNAPDEADNPHLWYYPATMPAVAAQVAADLGRLQPWHRRYFSQRLALFDRSLLVWHRALVSLRRSGRGVAVAVTEPVANYLLQAAGLRVATPRALQLAVMNGTDPAPQDIAVQDLLIERHRVKALVYNEQVQDGVTKAFLAAARKAHVPVVGVYETMPARSYDYQHWVLSTVTDLARSIGLSTAPRSKGGSGLAPSLPTAPRGGSRP